MNRVAELSTRTEIEARTLNRVPFKNLVPLPEIIADTIGVGVSSKAVTQIYDTLIKKIGSEFYILLQADLSLVQTVSSPEIAEALGRVREGNIYVKPGYDGIFGVVKVFGDNERKKTEQKSFDLS